MKGTETHFFVDVSEFETVSTLSSVADSLNACIDYIKAFAIKMQNLHS